MKTEERKSIEVIGMEYGYVPEEIYDSSHIGEDLNNPGKDICVLSTTDGNIYYISMNDNQQINLT